MVNNPPAMQEMEIQHLGQEDSLEKEMTTHSSILAWTIPWTEEPGGLQFMWPQRVGHGWLEGLMLKLKLQYFGHLMRRADSFEKTLMLGKIDVRRGGDGRGWDGWMASPTQWTWVWVNPGSWWWTGRPGVLRFMGSQRVGHDWATELNWSDSATAEVVSVYLIF